MLSALFKEERIINPESQKTGIDITKPVIFIASAERSKPTIFNIVFAIIFVALVFSKKTPITVPKAMISPILESVLPKPSEIVTNSVSPFIPNKPPEINAANNKEKTG